MEQEETIWIPWNGEGERPLTSVLVKVKGGTFKMGSDRDKKYDYFDKPAHKVTLTYDYWIGKYEVTFDEYDAYCAATGRKAPDDEGWGRGQRPVINVSWEDAIGYCNWLSRNEGLREAYRKMDSSHWMPIDGNRDPVTDNVKVEGYRLPTEAEWEYAARGGQNAKGHEYAGSDDLNEVGWYGDNSDVDGTGRKTQPVGRKKPNELGLYDMSGNVNEWCFDLLDIERPRYKTGAKTNPMGPEWNHYTRFRRIRGGSCSETNDCCCVERRGDPRNRVVGGHIGIRLVRTVL